MIFLSRPNDHAGSEKEGHCEDGAGSSKENGEPSKDSIQTPPKNILRGRKGVLRFTVFLILGDILLWSLIYLGISKLTGSYNMVRPNAVIIPILVLIAALSLIGAYRIRTDFASLRYASEHLIACIASYPVAAFFLYVIASYGSGTLSSRAIYTVSWILFC
jgi:hypothetical protein